MGTVISLFRHFKISVNCDMFVSCVDNIKCMLQILKIARTKTMWILRMIFANAYIERLAINAE